MAKQIDKKKVKDWLAKYGKEAKDSELNKTDGIFSEICRLHGLDLQNYQNLKRG